MFSSLSRRKGRKEIKCLSYSILPKTPMISTLLKYNALNVASHINKSVHSCTDVVNIPDLGRMHVHTICYLKVNVIFSILLLWSTLPNFLHYRGFLLNPHQVFPLLYSPYQQISGISFINTSFCWINYKLRPIINKCASGAHVKR